MAPRYEPLRDPRLDVLDQLDAGVWITDAEEARILWANRGALAIWRATDLDELLNRPNTSSEIMRATLVQIRERVKLGARLCSDRTIYPLGVATLVRMTLSGYELPDGRTALFVEAVPHSGHIDPDVLRASEAVRYAPLAVSTHTLDGATLTANATARRVFGNHFAFRDIFVDPDLVGDALAQIAGKKAFSEVIAATTTAGVRWYEIDARAIPDPVTGADAMVVAGHDVTLRIEADRYKDEFVSVVSHELRTPLTGIQGALDLLHHGVGGEMSASVTELVQIAHANTLRLRRIVDDILDVQKIAAGALELRRQPIALCEIVRAALALQRPAAELSEVTLAVTSPALPPAPVLADAGRIGQVLANLLSNAIKHAPRGTVVDVDIQPHDDRVRVSVSDQGPGVPEEFRGRLFTRFAQADTSTTRSVKGTGLGLYIARMIVEAHGGTIGCEAAATGATFFVELPVAATPA